MSLWRIRQVEFRRHELDFLSSGRGKHPTTSVIADGAEIINALDLFDTTEDPMQTIVCDACGLPGCNSGNYVVARRFEDGLLLMPAFDAMAEEDPELTEYRPPHFVAKHGSALFAGPALAMLAERVPFFADPKRWPPLTMRETVRLVQCEAPWKALGVFPDRPRLREDLISVASHGPGREAYDALDDAIARALDDVRPAATVVGEPVTFYGVEQAGFPEWSPLTFDGSRYRLALEAGIGVEPV